MRSRHGTLGRTTILNYSERLMDFQNAALRILDANANRAMEGMRVVEEYLRFVLQDGHLTEVCKQLRHDLADVIGSLPHIGLLTARDTEGDVGTRISAADEYQRATLHDIWSANQKRVEQSLRCLEEFAKPDFPSTAAAIEQLRYRAYTLAKAVASTNHCRERLATVRLYVLVDGGPSLRVFTRVVERLITAGAHVLQLRDKKLSDRECLERAHRLRAVTRGTSTLFIMNDRPDMANLADADGVHVGQQELAVRDVRAILGPHRLIGVSTHSLDQARQAVLDGANYLGCGPTFPSETKSFALFPGLEFLRQVAAEISLPAFAIGGITTGNLRSVLQTGCSRVAVSGAIAQSPTPELVVQELLSILGDV